MDYGKLEYNLLKDAHLNNCKFIDTAIRIATAKLYSTIDSAFIPKILDSTEELPINSQVIKKHIRFANHGLMNQ